MGWNTIADKIQEHKIQNWNNLIFFLVGNDWTHWIFTVSHFQKKSWDVSLVLCPHSHTRPLGSNTLSAPSETRLPGLLGPGGRTSDSWSTLARDTGRSWNQKTIAKPQETTLKLKITWGGKKKKPGGPHDCPTVVKCILLHCLCVSLVSVVGHSTCVWSTESWSQSAWGT